MHSASWIAIAVVFFIIFVLAARRRSEQAQGAPGAAAGVVFTVVLRGYDMAQVDALVARSTAGERGTPLRADIERFLGAPTVVLRGYDREQVNRYLSQVLADPNLP